MTAESEPPESEFRRNWEIFADDASARQEALRQELRLFDRWLNGLCDPDAGDVGSAFRAAFAATGCTEDVSADTGDAEAYFNAFSRVPGEDRFTFTNKIVYGPAALDERGNLFAARCHESLHAIQYSRAPIMHAVPYNTGAPVLLCPRDFALLVQLTERDTFAKQTWLASLAARARPDIIFTDIMDATVPRLEELRGFPLTFVQALAILGHQIMECIGPVDSDLIYNQHYGHEALERYDAFLSLRENDIREGRCTLIRLEAQDLRDVSGAFGPVLMDGIPVPPPLLPQDREAIQRLNEQLGITDENNLPTMREALSARGLKPETLLPFSKNPVPDSPSSPAPKPE